MLYTIEEVSNILAGTINSVKPKRPLILWRSTLQPQRPRCLPSDHRRILAVAYTFDRRAHPLGYQFSDAGGLPSATSYQSICQRSPRRIPSPELEERHSSQAK